MEGLLKAGQYLACNKNSGNSSVNSEPSSRKSIKNISSIRSSLVNAHKLNIPSWILIALPLIPTLALLIQSGFEYHNLILFRTSIIKTKDKVFSQTDDTLGTLSSWEDLPEDKMFQSKLRFQIRLDDFRQLILDDKSLSTEKILEYYNYITGLLLNTLSKRIKSMDGTSYWRFLISYKNALRAVNSAGVSGAIVLQYYHNSDFQDDDLITLLKHRTLSQEYLAQTINFVPEYRELLQKIRSSDYYKFISMSVNETLQNPKTAFKDKEAYDFFVAERKYIDDLRSVQDYIEKNILEISSEEFSNSRRSQIIGILLLCLLISISFLIVMLTRNSTQALKHVTISSESHVKKINTSVNFSCISFLMINVINHYQNIESMEDMIPSLNKLLGFIEREVKNHDIEINEFINDTILLSIGTDKTKYIDITDFEAYLATKIAKFSLLLMTAITQNLLRTNKQVFGGSSFLKLGIHSGQVTTGIINMNGILKYIMLGPGIKEVKVYCHDSEENKIHASQKIKTLIEMKNANSTFLFEKNASKIYGECNSYWLTGYKTTAEEPKEVNNSPLKEDGVNSKKNNWTE
ncbi:unnamed protein product [Lepeophtheirus salmonis]|uniref:(salmon louse) hypothetical protein n=1 Tax=Lepeophtheirus salmonis TaxID=72036 RepID=A0A7R8H314_LEPSM|nr:unnamed protein product [Lepeophtheirus salmonis]CAF2833563.1 unnamed protein product [Lepeophtheirus salmonis]